MFSQLLGDRHGEVICTSDLALLHVKYEANYKYWSLPFVEGFFVGYASTLEEPKSVVLPLKAAALGIGPLASTAAYGGLVIGMAADGGLAGDCY